MSKPLNHDRRVRQLLTRPVGKGSNPVALAMIVRSAGGRHPDKRKAASRNACRGRASADA